MGSLSPFANPNYFPHTTTIGSTSSSVAVSGSGTVNPRIEPKLEPLDEELDYIPIPHQLPPYNPTFSSNSQTYASMTGQNPSLFPYSPEPNNFYPDRTGGTGIRETNPLADRTGGYEALAIVPVADGSRYQLSTTVISPRGKFVRSGELVRIVDMSPEDERFFRDSVRRTRMLFDSLRVYGAVESKRMVMEGGRQRNRGDLMASSLMRKCGLWLYRDKRIVGALPGIEIGDVFLYRMELCVLGIHGQNQAGIDYVPASVSSNGEPVATSIIVSGGYEDDEDAGDVIIYTGHGGQNKQSKQCVSQKLEGGNLGLERSMRYGVEVRVIRGFRYDGSASGKIYVYDGLYRVVETWFDQGKSGFGVYKFKIVRLDNQPAMGSAILKFAQSLKTKPFKELSHLGYICQDISKGMENLPVLLFNDIDGDYEPLNFEYLVRSVIPSFVSSHGSNGGCDCGTVCLENCSCALKNGGEFPYDDKGILVRGKPLIYECGPHCRCPPSCHNRVTQKGVKNRLVVFRSQQTGWGVRSLDMIQAGAFICEYAGVFLTREQAEVFSMGGDRLIYPNRFAKTWTEWGDLSEIYSNYLGPSGPSVPSLEFAMDVSTYRNVACYMSDSNSPNVMVQFVLYDHSNVMFPRLMLFAMENIPPLRDLSLDYGVADEWSSKLAICN